MNLSRRALLWAGVLATALTGAGAQEEKPAPAPDQSLSALYGGMVLRNIGPFRGGRGDAVAGVRGQPLVYYLGSSGGGVWKTVDAASSWRPVSDKDFRTGSVGAIAVAESNPNVLYVGMGESAIRGNVSNGDGVYKSTDAGKTWSTVGLANTHQISRVRVDPKDPNLVYVAAQGHVWGPNPERGVFRSKDGGKTWDKVLFVSDHTGASDLCMDPTNPRTLYAGFWQVSRKPWALSSGGTEGGVYKSTDGGDNWKKLAGGLPEGVVGKVGIAVSPARPERVWAIVEAKTGGVYRSEDGGEKWTRVNSENRLRQRAWYYTKIYADPKSPDTVYVLNSNFYRSNDGGISYVDIPVPHSDNHDLWIDPDDPARMVESNDGGANVTFNGGETWSSIMNQATGQFYRVTTDDHFPYRVYGGQQDNTTVAISSRGRGDSIGAADWYPVGGGESGWIAPRPGNPDVVFAGSYGGSITRWDRKTGESRLILAWPQLAMGRAAKDVKYRFSWNAPILISRHDPKTLYHAAQMLLVSRDEGQSWQEISPDLTRNDPAKQEKSGGPITKDDTGVEVYDTIFALAESPRAAGVLWAGTDDGLVHLTRDGGAHWENVTPKALPEWIQINSIEASPHDAATAYLAATLYRLDDFRPFLYRTNDYGKTWTKIINGIPPHTFTRVVREDPVRKGLLYAGTEYGLFVSFDDGASWEAFQRNLPVVPVTDLAVKDGDLVVATQGRSFWILDDLTPLREYRPALRTERLHVFAPRPSYRFWTGASESDEGPAGEGKNPPIGVVVFYSLREKPAENETLTVEIAEGERVLRTYSSKKPEEKAGEPEGGADPRVDKPLEPKAGLNRLVWDMRILRPALLARDVIWEDFNGPLVASGTYTVRMKLGSDTRSQTFQVLPRPGISATPEDLKRQREQLRQTSDAVVETNEAVQQIRDVKAQIERVTRDAEHRGKDEALSKQGNALSDRLTEVERKLVNPDVKSGQDVYNFPPALDHQFLAVASVVSSADAKPTDSSIVYYGQIRAQLDAILAELKAVLDGDLAAFNKAVRAADIPPVVVPPPKKAE